MEMGKKGGKMENQVGKQKKRSKREERRELRPSIGNTKEEGGIKDQSQTW